MVSATAYRYRYLVSRLYFFDERVAVGAYYIWEGKIAHRRLRDWYDAHGAFARSRFDAIFPSDPRYARVMARAEALYDSRKTADAREDWLEAEQIFVAAYIMEDRF